jgi:hypothetical protein
VRRGLAAERIALSLDLMAWGLETVRLRIARENPTATAAQRDAMMQAWLDKRNGALRPGERTRPLVPRTKSGVGSRRR